MAKSKPTGSKQADIQRILDALTNSQGQIIESSGLDNFLRKSGREFKGSVKKFQKKVQQKLEAGVSTTDYDEKNFNYRIEIGQISDLGNTSTAFGSVGTTYGGTNRGIRDVLGSTYKNIQLCRTALNTTNIGKNFRRKVGALISYRIADNFRRQKDSKGRDWAQLKIEPKKKANTVGTRKKQGASWRHPTIKQLRKDGKLDQSWEAGLKRKDSKALRNQFNRSKIVNRPGETITETVEDEGINFTITRQTEARQERVDVGYARARNILSGQLKQGKKNRKRAAESKVKRNTKQNMPLIDTGEFFTELVGQASKAIGGELGNTNAFKNRTSANAVVKEQPFSIKLSFRGGVGIEPNKDLSNRTKALINIHNRPVGQNLKSGYGAKIPGREFLYIQKTDEKFIMKALAAIILAGGGDSRIIKKEDGTRAKINVNVRNSNVSQKAFRDLADTGNKQALLGQLMRMGYYSSLRGSANDEDIIVTEATLAFIDEAQNVNKIIRDRIRKVTGDSVRFDSGPVSARL